MGAFDAINDAVLSGGRPWAKFERIGDTITGTITGASERQQRDYVTGEPKVWDDGTPQMEQVLEISTSLRDADVVDDNGDRVIVVNKYAMRKAIAAELRSKRTRLADGGTITVTYTGDAEPKQRGMSGAKQFSVTYVDPPKVAMDAGMFDKAESVLADSGITTDEPPF